MKNTILLFLLISASIMGCKADNQSKNTEETTSAEEIPAEEVAPTTTKYKVYPFEPSVSFDDASIESMAFKNGKFNFELGAGSYELGVQTPDADAKMCANSAEGQHIHLILDNGPYAAKYTSEFDYDVTDGDHILLAFLSRSYHESIKTDKANVAKKITVKDNSIVTESDITEPMLFYSRPKGTYVGVENTQKVMLDYYLKNIKEEDGYKVKANINGENHILDKWQPYYIEGLPMGSNTITLSLQDKYDNAVDTPLNPVTRKFELKEAPNPEN